MARKLWITTIGILSLCMSTATRTAAQRDDVYRQQLIAALETGDLGAVEAIVPLFVRPQEKIGCGEHRSPLAMAEDLSVHTHKGKSANHRNVSKYVRSLIIPKHTAQKLLLELDQEAKKEARVEQLRPMVKQRKATAPKQNLQIAPWTADHSMVMTFIASDEVQEARAHIQKHRIDVRAIDPETRRPLLDLIQETAIRRPGETCKQWHSLYCELCAGAKPMPQAAPAKQPEERVARQQASKKRDAAQMPERRVGPLFHAEPEENLLNCIFWASLDALSIGLGEMG